jgi:hypothetical protein
VRPQSSAESAAVTPRRPVQRSPKGKEEVFLDDLESELSVICIQTVSKMAKQAEWLESCRNVFSGYGLPLQEHPKLKEMNFGAFSIPVFGTKGNISVVAALKQVKATKNEVGAFAEVVKVLGADQGISYRLRDSTKPQYGRQERAHNAVGQ